MIYEMNKNKNKNLIDPHQKYIQILIQSLVLPFSGKQKSITVYVT